MAEGCEVYYLFPEEKLKKVTSWYPSECKWCAEIRQKYALRKEIVEMLELPEIANRFENLQHYARCPVHRLITASPRDQKAIGKFSISIEAEREAIVFQWWTNSYDYRVVWEPRKYILTFERDPEDDDGKCTWATISVFDVNDNPQLLQELLTLCSKEELQEILNFIEKITEKEGGDCGEP